MMKITILAMAGLKESYLREAAAEYQKRLGGYCSLKIIERPPVHLPEKPSEKEIAAALEKEGDDLLRLLPENAYVTVLCIEGRQYSSEAFAHTVEHCRNAGQEMVFVIGSSYGLAEKVKARGHAVSFSEMTFPHQLFRVMLLEQLYRAFRINSGGAYHK